MSLSAYVSRNGVLIPSAQASVSVFNPAIYGAYGVYESLQVVNGTGFEQAAHLRRLAHSAEILDLPLPAGSATLDRWIAEVIGANTGTNHPAPYTLRIFVIGPDNGETVAFIWPQPQPVYPEAFFTAGAPAITFEGHRYLPQAKSLNALASYMAQRQARAAGVHEALLHHAGVLTEGSNSNLFVVVDGMLTTPPAGEVLSGVTRDIVIALAAGGGIPLAEAPLPVAELARWDECFITSTSRHVMPVTSIDGQPVGAGQVGPITRQIMSRFESYFVRHTAQA